VLYEGDECSLHRHVQDETALSYANDHTNSFKLSKENSRTQWPVFWSAVISHIRNWHPVDYTISITL